MAKVKIFVVHDYCGAIQYIGCNKQDAINTALEWEAIPSFERWIEEWMVGHAGKDILDLLDRVGPKVLLRNEYFECIEKGIDDGEFCDFATYEVDIPVEALLKTDKIAPEVLVMITNIFKS